MIKFIKKAKHYRVYLEGSSADIVKLASYINENYYEPNKYLEETYLNAISTQELDNIIFIDEDGSSYFPLGLLDFLQALCKQLEIETELGFEPEQVELLEHEIDPDILEGITLRHYQQQVVSKALSYKRGLIMSPTGSGKTAMIAAIIKHLLQEREHFKVIVGVPSVYLLHQTYQEFLNFGISEQQLGRMGDGYSLDPSKAVIISTVATLYSEVTDGKDEFYQHIDCLFFDEAHHTSAFTWYTVIDNMETEYIFGVSASPFYGDKEHLLQDLLVRGAIGPIIHKVEQRDLVESGYISRPYIFVVSSWSDSNIKFLIDWQPLYKTGIINNKSRNRLIIQLADYLVKLGRRPLITLQRIAHGKNLAKDISKQGHIVAFIQGGSKVTLYRDGRASDAFKDDNNVVRTRFEAGKIDCLIGTSTLDEGVDMPSISSVILAGGQKAQIKTLQRVGRGLRRKDGDNTTYIFDFSDDFNVVLAKHAKERQKVFRALHIPIFEVKDLSQLDELINSLRETTK